MSRKDPRRAIAIAIPPAVMARLRARQARSRGRRLMDTLRAALADALAVAPPTLAPVPPAPHGTPVRLLQLPRHLRRALAAVCRDTGLAPQAAIAALVMGLDADRDRGTPDASMPHASGTACSTRGPALECGNSERMADHAATAEPDARR